MLFLAVVVGFGGYAFADEHGHAGHAAEVPQIAGEKKEAGNKICPVDGEEIGSMGEAFKIEHGGKVYDLCCAACEMKFKEDPEKYAGIVEKELAEEMAEEVKPVQLDEHGHDHSKPGTPADEHHDHHDHSSHK